MARRGAALPGRRQVGRATSGTWSPTLKKNIALGSVDAALRGGWHAVEIEWTVEARRGRVGATVAPMPFFDSTAQARVIA